MSLRLWIVILFMINTCLSINIKQWPPVNSYGRSVQLCLETIGESLSIEKCNSFLAIQQFYYLGDLSKWNTDSVSENSQSPANSISGAIMTACPTDSKYYLNNDATFSDNSNVNFRFTLIKTPSAEDMTQRQWTIQQTNSEGLCLTLVDKNDESFLVNFTKCEIDHKNQLWTLNDFTVDKDGTC
jgi:hypothetical protein